MWCPAGICFKCHQKVTSTPNILYIVFWMYVFFFPKGPLQFPTGNNQGKIRWCLLVERSDNCWHTKWLSFFSVHSYNPRGSKVMHNITHSPLRCWAFLGNLLYVPYIYYCQTLQTPWKHWRIKEGSSIWLDLLRLTEININFLSFPYSLCDQSQKWMIATFCIWSLEWENISYISFFL